ncbi:hypothetical protein ACF3DV_10610 [Chlorogloeopsis fritschii PCC 9212]|uniref:Uncharacterized protein n=1 Tax=Chlorogloeopsis fritschii PCC 6912 TaxID=211165 RepID=A0A433MYA5_CHLFR|nr:hypothetical protein [Chlorogloeopsis fritschii]RUR73288.1 hypothetical protein PCC6912_58130 [Chlorogloeopsis fritschii PCC 6912]
MSSSESSNSNIIEVDGIQFETLMPERVVQIPPKLLNAKFQVQFGIRITNNTAITRSFLLFFARPQFLQLNQQKVPKFGPNVNGSYNPLLSDFQLLIPGKSLTLALKGYFQWESHKLKFVFIEKGGCCWIFSDFKPGTYWGFSLLMKINIQHGSRGAIGVFP